ncbi:hypothetical protein GGI25_003997 [Coemansia spiralis]|uniref:SET domain-containing protein n=2 Tax=Coemansia TaxID=4863 RepID=A0A9W8G122_9FUNG|nr:hypothetical protein EDC05_002344 [Coemansia umbellata]KAJ2623797.1 hypothetical protein GGI26_002035 [Coemansia sp. RSA 1358]KAJ2675259.1 hypothetical protein GGI25_003997 [Coemansia spiralis]
MLDHYQFTKTFREAGVTVEDSARILTPLDGERGVFIKEQAINKAIATKSCLVRIPAPLIITAAVASRVEVIRQCSARLGEFDAPGEATLLALFVLVENAKGAGSSWQWYINSLPRYGTSALFYGKAELDALSGTPLQMAVEAKLRQLHVQYDSFSDILQDWKKEHGVSGSVSFDAFKWANFITLSRAFSLQNCIIPADSSSSNDLLPHAGGDRALLPFLDLFNHSSQPSVHWSVDTVDGSVLAFVHAASNGPCISTEGLSFSELHLSYGAKSNTEWLYEYGFLPENNEHDAWPYFTNPTGTAQLVAIKQLWMLELGLSSRVMFFDPEKIHDAASVDSSQDDQFISRSAMLSLCLASLDDTSDACLRTIGAVVPEHPYFTVQSIYVDDDDKLLQIPGLRKYALDQCAAFLQCQANELQEKQPISIAEASPGDALPLPEQRQQQQRVADVNTYIRAESLLVRRIAQAVVKKACLL